MILFIGEAPGPRGTGPGLHYYFAARALEDGASYLREPRAWVDRLLASSNPIALALANAHHVNLLRHYPGTRWPSALARANANVVLERLALYGREYDRIVLVGRRVATACGLSARFFSPTSWSRRPAWVVPHPSGLSRTWNAPATSRRSRELLTHLGEFYAPPGRAIGPEKLSRPGL